MWNIVVWEKGKLSRKRKKELDDLARSWFEQTTIKEIEWILLTLCLCVMVKSERKEKEVKEGETYHHC